MIMAVPHCDSSGIWGIWSGKASLPLDGQTWGLRVPWGQPKKFCGLTFEPFIKGGYRVV